MNDGATNDADEGNIALNGSMPSLEPLLRRCQVGIDNSLRELEEAQERVKNLKARVRESQTIEEFLSKITVAQNNGHPSEALRVIRSGPKVVAVIADRERRAGELVAELERTLTARVAEDFKDLLGSFPSAARDAGLPLDATSRHPKYTLAARLVQVDFDKSRLETRVTTPGGRKSFLGIDVPVVVTHLKSELARLNERPFEPEAFVERLRSAYAAASANTDSKGADGGVRLKAVIDEMGADKSFSLDEFVVDLSKIVQTDGVGSRIRLDHTRDSAQGLLLWGLEDRGYYGYVRVE